MSAKKWNAYLHENNNRITLGLKDKKQALQQKELKSNGLTNYANMILWFEHSTNAQCNHRTPEKCEASKFLLLKSTKAFTKYRIVQHSD